jgi:hypothetical protein
MQQQWEGKHARSAELRQQHMASVVQKAADETRKVEEVAFINQLLGQDRKLCLQQKHEDGERFACCKMARAGYVVCNL